MHLRRRLRALLPPLLLVAVLLAASVVWINAEDSTKQADLATSAIAGAIIALAVLALERSLSRQQDRQRQLASLATEANIRGMRFTGADLRSAYAAGRDLRDCVFCRADLRSSRLTEARCERASFDRADLRHADLRWADLTQADLRGTDLRHARLGKTSLAGADLSDADLRVAVMFQRGNGYASADLSGAALFGADLRHVALIARDRARDGSTFIVEFKDARANGETRWPAGFDPVAAGIEVLPGKERQPHDYYVAFKDPGFDDVTATTAADEASTLTYSPSHRTYPYGYQWDVLESALGEIRDELRVIRAALTEVDPRAGPVSD